MRKKIRPKYESLRKEFPIFFWKKCCMCKLSFRREWGWSAITQFGGYGQEKYVCNKCGPTREAADDIFLEGKWLPPQNPPQGSGVPKKISDEPRHVKGTEILTKTDGYDPSAGNIS